MFRNGCQHHRHRRGLIFEQVVLGANCDTFYVQQHFLRLLSGAGGVGGRVQREHRPIRLNRVTSVSSTQSPLSVACLEMTNLDLVKIDRRLRSPTFKSQKKEKNIARLKTTVSTVASC